MPVQFSCDVSARHRLVTPSHLRMEQTPSAAQGTPIAQVAAQVAPPQVALVSTPSLTPFEQEVHLLASHCVLVQSNSPLKTPDSVPSATPLKQDAQTSFSQWLSSMQSLAARHAAPSAHCAQV